MPGQGAHCLPGHGEAPEHLVEVYVAELHVDYGVDILAVGLEPCGLGGHHIGYGHHTLVESDGGATQILVGGSDVAAAHIVGFQSLVGAESRLTHL